MQYVFVHKRLGYRFVVEAPKYYYAIKILEAVLGAEKYWVNDYICLANGKEVAYKQAS